MHLLGSKLRDLFTTGREFVYERDDIIIRSGDTPSGVYFITKGWVKAYSLCRDGEQNIFATLYEGEAFPVAWAVTGQLRDVNFAAVDTVEVWRISHEEFIAGIAKDAEMAQAALQSLGQTFFSMVSELDNLFYHCARERVVYRLFSVASRFGHRSGKRVVIKKRIPNEYIARSTNMTRETASREMSRLVRKQLIEHDRDHLVIADINLLKREIGSGFDLTALGILE